mmetsp:Transcript_27005/g.23891  ORF Transcript_27005/g.23891 Transcript_27005/m.23891 type:complete len:129 (+) Transcript_27005:720-1106(+)
MLIHLGSAYDSMSQTPDNMQGEISKGSLTIKFLDGPKAEKIYKFNNDDKQVKIGRMHDCQIKFEGNSLSRYQCTLENINGNWYVNDGAEGKVSTNGTWLFVEDFFEIQDNSVIKVGQTLFRCVILKKK